MKCTIPRLVVAGTSSGSGKTTTMVALTTALRRRGLRVAVFKCGPDYLDPTYHERAAGRRAHNLDGWMMGRDAVLRSFARACEDADIALIEGVMGLFDGADPTDNHGSAAELAQWLKAPVLVVHDCRGIARTVAPIAYGLRYFDPAVPVSGLWCNRVGSIGHLDLLRRAKPCVEILGGLPRCEEAQFSERHLGLRAANRSTLSDETLARWGDLAESYADLEAIVDLAGRAEPIAIPELPELDGALPRGRLSGPRIGIAVDAAFSFYYPENLALLRACGAELVEFSPIADTSLPKVDGLYIGGGYPECHAAELAANSTMLAALRAHAAAGKPLYAECGGLMYLADAIIDQQGRRHALAGCIPGVAHVQSRLAALGYARVELQRSCFLGPKGLCFRGHQFRYSRLDVEGCRAIDHCYEISPTRKGKPPMPEGYRLGNVIASYVHAHWSSCPEMAGNFVAACAVTRPNISDSDRHSATLGA